MLYPGSLCHLVGFLPGATVREGPWGGEALKDLTKNDLILVLGHASDPGQFSVKVLTRAGLVGWMSEWDIKEVPF